MVVTDGRTVVVPIVRRGEEMIENKIKKEEGVSSTICAGSSMVRNG
jgi:hypothetical protein